MRKLLLASAALFASASIVHAQPASPAAPVVVCSNGLPCPQATGVTNASNASTGLIGEAQSVQVTSSAPVTLTSGTMTNIVTVPLSAGDWQCSSVIDFALTGATFSGFQAGLSSTSATLGAQDTYIGLPMTLSLLSTTITQPTPRMRINSASAFNVYLVAFTTFTVGTVKSYGTVFCRRMH